MLSVQQLLTGAIISTVNSLWKPVMPIKFSEDVVPLSDLKVNPGKIVSQANKTKRPILVTSRGRGVAVVQGLEEYEIREEKVAFMQAVAQGLIEAKEGKVTGLTEAKRVLGLEK